MLMEYLGHTSFDAVMGLEIGGANGLEPLLVGSTRFFDAPVIDADCKCLSCVSFSRLPKYLTTHRDGTRDANVVTLFFSLSLWKA